MTRFIHIHVGERREELALEEHAVEQLEAQADAAWKRGHYVLADLLRDELERAREHVARLEGEERA